MANLTKQDQPTSLLVSLQFQGKTVPVSKDVNTGILWFSLTEMCKHWEADLKEWLSNKSTSAYLNAVDESYSSKTSKGGIPPFDEISVIKAFRGGKHPGTWAVPEVAIELARWLDPAFSVWVNQQIMELMSKGFVNVTRESRLDLECKRIVNLANQERDFGYQLKASLRFIGPDKNAAKQFIGAIIRGLKNDYSIKNRLFDRLKANVLSFIEDNQESWTSEQYSDYRWVVEYVVGEHKNYRGRVIGQTGTKRTRDPSPLSKSLIENVVLD